MDKTQQKEIESMF